MQDFSQEERDAIKELVLHPKFGAFLNDWKDYDSLVKRKKAISFDQEIKPLTSS